MRRLGTVFAIYMLVACPFAPGQVAGLAASPNPVNLSAAFAGAGVTPSIVSITFNGALVTPISIQSITTTTGQQWLQVFITGASVNVSANTSIVGVGTYTGTVVVNTVVGAISFGVNLAVGATPPATPAPTSWILVLTGLAGVGLYQTRRRFTVGRFAA